MDLFTHLTNYCNKMSFTFNYLKDVNIFVINNDIDNCHEVYKLLPDSKITVTTDDCINAPFVSERYENILDFKTRNIHIYPECWDSVLTS